MLRDVLGVPAHTTDQRGGERELEEPAHEVQTGLALRDAPFVRRLSALVEDGRSIHPKSGRKPVHQITFDTSMTRPSSKDGNPSRTPVVLGTRSIRGGELLRPHPFEWRGDGQGFPAEPSVRSAFS